MKQQCINLLIVIMVMATSCSKEKDATVPDDFTVTAVAHGYKAGDTVQFTLTGKPDMILFYSGEPGKIYENRNRTSAVGTTKMVFQTSVQQGPSLTLPGGDSLQVLIATNLEGYNAEHILKANWADITARNKKWPTSLNTSFTTSDSIDISDFSWAAQINIAFRVIGKKNPAYPQRKRQVQNLTINNNLPDGTSTLLFSNFANIGWVQASLKNDNNPGTPANNYVGFNAWNVGTWNVSLTDSMRNSNGIPIRSAYPITFDPGTMPDNDDNDDWLLTSSVDLKTTKPDAGTIIKNKVGIALTTYKYIFKTAGTYNITFIAMNVTADETTEIVRQLQVTVLPQ